MLAGVLSGRLRSLSYALFRCSAMACGAVSCTSPPGAALCPSVTGTSDGLQVMDCPRGTISMTGTAYDSTGAKTSYAFVVMCNGRSAHGIWSSTGGLVCIEGAYPCDGSVCTPTSDADCRVLSNCVQLGECGYVDGKCVLTDDGCSKSEIPCGLSGACHLVNGACAATSDSDCQMPFGNCPACPFKGACVTSGNCTEQNGVCIATQNGDCMKSQQCAFAGKCTLMGNECIAATDADCARSEVCRTAGQCAAIQGSCGVR